MNMIMVIHGDEVSLPQAEI